MYLVERAVGLIVEASLRQMLKSRGVQLTLFIGSAVIGAAGMLSGSWMVARGDFYFMTGIVGSLLPLAIGCIGLHKIIKAKPLPVP
jgi:hypothetical protein